jgi:thiamine pyrophosphate-dependent acetolactate synthase large subunit-like protein
MDALMLDRRDLVRQLLIDRGDLLVVCGLGSATYDVAAAGDHPLNFYLWGAMGGTGMLMGIGSLATIGVKAPKNLAIVVLDNTHYGETGMQPSHTDAGVDLVAIARACRFRDARSMSRIDHAAEVRALLHAGEGPIFVSARIKPEEAPRVLPLRDGHAIKQRFVAALSSG